MYAYKETVFIEIGERDNIIASYKDSGYTISETVPESVHNSIAKAEKEKPVKIFRDERNQLLFETDWWASSDLTMSADQTAYRKALRDLPSTATPSLDSDGQLTGVNWPTKPE